MKKQNKKGSPLRVSCITAVLSFVALSFFADGLIEFSRDAGTLRWLADAAVYMLLNKLAAKLAASLLLGCAAYFVSSMIEYGKEIKSRKRARAMRVSFQQEQPQRASRSA